MSVHFCNPQGHTLMTMGRRNAEAFLIVTTTVCDFYKVPLMMSAIVNDEVVLQEAEFCALVEKVLQSPSYLFYSWAEVAAALYETIKGKKYRWQWPARITPRHPFVPYRQVDFIPIEESTEVIGVFDLPGGFTAPKVTDA